MNTITAVLEAQRHHSKEQKAEPPRKYAIVLHAKPGSRTAGYIAAHLLADHANLDDNVVLNAVETAYRDGKAIVKPVTKDVGDTIVSLCNRCGQSESPLLKITCEEI